MMLVRRRLLVVVVMVMVRPRLLDLLRLAVRPEGRGHAPFLSFSEWPVQRRRDALPKPVLVV